MKWRLASGANCVFRIVQLFSFLMKASTKAKRKTKGIPFDPIFFAASVPAREPTAKDLKDVTDHEKRSDRAHRSRYDGGHGRKLVRISTTL